MHLVHIDVLHEVLCLTSPSHILLKTSVFFSFSALAAPSPPAPQVPGLVCKAGSH